jgi:hypothetical protein
MSEILYPLPSQRRFSVLGSYELFFIVLLSCVLMSLQLQHSLRQGTLAMPMTYDDIGYFHDALRRVDIWYNHGLPAFFSHFVQNPPHSPWSTLLCMAGIVIFGPVEWGPSVIASFFTLFVFWWIYEYWLSALPLKWMRWSIVIMVASWPMMAHAVIDLRPDIPTAFFTVTCLLMLLEQDCLRQSKTLIIAGTFFALALLCKPSFAPAIILMVGWTFLLALICLQLTHRIPAVLYIFNAQTRWSLIFFLLPVAAVAVPYYLISWRDTLEYIHWVLDHQVADKGLWQLKMSLREELAYYVTGASARFTMGIWHLFAPMILIFMGSYLVVKQGSQTRRTALHALLSFVLVYSIVTFQTMKTPFFGVFVQWMLLLGSIIVLTQWLVAIQNHPLSHMVKYGMIAFTLLVVPITFNWAWYYRTNSYASTTPELARYEHGRIEAITSLILKQSKPNLKVFVSMPGPFINPEVLDTELLRHGRSDVTITDVIYNDDKKLFENGMKNADIVIAYSKDDPEAYTWEFKEDFRQDILSYLHTHKEFNLVDTIKSPAVGKTYIFTKRDPTIASLVQQARHTG